MHVFVYHWSSPSLSSFRHITDIQIFVEWMKKRNSLLCLTLSLNSLLFAKPANSSPCSSLFSWPQLFAQTILLLQCPLHFSSASLNAVFKSKLKFHFFHKACHDPNLTWSPDSTFNLQSLCYFFHSVFLEPKTGAICTHRSWHTQHSFYNWGNRVPELLQPAQ